MANLFYNHNYQFKKPQNRKGACFSVTMPFSVEKRLKEIQNSMGLNSRSQTIVFLVQYYDREDKAIDSIDRLAKAMADFKAVNGLQNEVSSLETQQEFNYNNHK